MSDTSSGCYNYPPTSFTSTSPDGSGYTISVTGGTINSLVASDGALISPYTQAVLLQDRNGNQITVDSSGNYYDTLSGTTPVLAQSGSGTPSSPLTFTYTAPSNSSAIYTVKYTSSTVQTNFGCSGITEYGPHAINLVSEIDLPDISVNPEDKYTFSYEPTPGYPGSGHCPAFLLKPSIGVSRMVVSSGMHSFRSQQVAAQDLFTMNGIHAARKTAEIAPEMPEKTFR
jgi:hypothetical protein